MLPTVCWEKSHGCLRLSVHIYTAFIDSKSSEILKEPDSSRFSLSSLHPQSNKLSWAMKRTAFRGKCCNLYIHIAVCLYKEYYLKDRSQIRYPRINLFGLDLEYSLKGMDGSWSSNSSYPNWGTFFALWIYT